MTRPYDTVIRGGWVVDDANAVDGPADVGIVAGQIAAVADELRDPAIETIDATGHYVLPGLVDLHVHVGHPTAGAAGLTALAKAGVTTAVDLSGPAAGVLGALRSSRSGVRVATVERLLPGEHLPARPTAADVDRAVARALDAGSVGVKLHVDAGWEPEPAALIIERAHALGVWVACHCGTTTAGSNLDGLRQTVALAGDVPVHIAHVNSYCRGELGPPLGEAEEAVAILRAAPHHLSESYLSPLNGNTAECRDGTPRNPRVAEWLRGAAYPGTQSGLQAALADGWAAIPQLRDGEVELLTGAEAVRAWLDADTKTMLCLPVNPALSRILLASSKCADRGFDVTAIATDGGAYPRNVTVAAGLALVELDVLSRRELVEKACRRPALALGLATRGHLGVGADADVTIVDRGSRRVRTTLVAGVPIVRDGNVIGAPTTLLTTDRGQGAAEAAGIAAVELLDLERIGLRTGATRDQMAVSDVDAGRAC